MGLISDDRNIVFIGTINLLIVGFACILIVAFLSKENMLKFGNIFTSSCKSDDQAIFNGKSILTAFGFICFGLGLVDVYLLTFKPHK